MDDDVKSVTQLLGWYKRILGFGGMWPLERSYFKFYIGALYFFMHMILTLSDLVSVFGDMSLTITNLLETSTQVMVTGKMLALAYSNLLVDVVQRIQSSANEDRYMDRAEKQLYMSYNAIARFLFLAGSFFNLMTILTLFLKPFESISRAALHNETIVYTLPCRMKLFYEIVDARTYALVYISQFPMMYYYYFDVVSTCFIGLLILHVIGDLAMLAHRIRQINSSDASKTYGDPAIAFRSILLQHHDITSIGTAIDEIFSYVLLVDLSVATVLVGLTCYNILEKSSTVSMIDFLFVLNYSAALLIAIFAYCCLGEFLIRESMSVHDAYYECRWYEMRIKHQKYLTICMAGARKPLKLTAGRFYIFSLPQFSGILKTSAAYISMLRTVT